MGLTVAMVGAVSELFWWAGTQPLYQPGDVGRGVQTVQPGSATLGPDGEWEVEPGVTLAHWSGGSGPHQVLFIHGLCAPTRMPAAAARLGEFARVSVYQQRGVGSSSQTFRREFVGNGWQGLQQLERTLGLGMQVADIERIRLLLHQDRLVLVGHSLGALTAALYAYEFPDHVAGLVLVAPSELLVAPPPLGGLLAQIKSALPAAYQAPFAALENRLMDFGALFTKTETVLAEEDAAFFNYYREVAGDVGSNVAPAGGSWTIRAFYLSLGDRRDWRAAMHTLHAPTLVIQGALDVQPPAVSDAWLDAIPNATRIILTQSGHFPQDSQPDEFALAIAAFVQALPPH